MYDDWVYVNPEGIVPKADVISGIARLFITKLLASNVGGQMLGIVGLPTPSVSA